MAALSFRAGSTTSAGSGGGDALAVNKGAGAAAGDIQMYGVYWEPNTNTVTCAGFTSLLKITNPNLFMLEVFYRRLDGSEGASFSFVPSTNGQWRTIVGALYRDGTYTGAQPDVSSSAQGDAVAQGSQIAPSVTTTGADRMLVYGHGMSSSGSITATTGAASNFRVHLGEASLADALFAVAGATGTTALGNGGTRNYAAIHAALISDPAAAAKAPPPPRRVNSTWYRRIG